MPARPAPLGLALAAFLVAASLLLAPSPGRATSSGGPTPLTAECVVRASSHFGVPIPVLLGILRVEGGRPGMESPNRNGSFDLGPMQINDRVWVPVLARLTGGDHGVARAILRDNGCANMIFAAWIVRQHLNATGDLATAVGWYHSRTPVHMARYQEKFRQSLLEIARSVRAAGG